jgi:hypothetical protein
MEGPHCSLRDRNEISNHNRGLSIDASYQVSVHLAKRFQRRISKISQICIFSAILDKIRATRSHNGILFLYENENFLDIVLDKSIISKASYLFKLIFRITISFPNLNEILH